MSWNLDRLGAFIKRSSFLALSAVLLGTAFFTVPSAQAIGISPPSMVFKDVLRNTEQIRTISLSRSPSETGDIHVAVSATGNGAGFLVGGEQTFMIPAAQERGVFPLKINPGNAADGTYQLILKFTKIVPEDKSSKGGVSIVTGVAARISVTVTGVQNLAYQLVDLYAGDSEVEAPLSTTYVVSNTGNVDWRPTKIAFHFTKTGEAEPSQTVILEELSIPAILAGNPNQRENALLSHGLAEGDYVLSADFFYRDELAGTVKGRRPFHIFPKDTFKQFGEITELKANKSAFSYGEKIQVDGTFKNTGQIPVKTTMLFMLKKKASVIDLVRGNTHDVAPLSEVTSTAFFDAKGSGAYVIEAYAEFGSKRSPLEQIPITIRPRGWVIMLETVLAIIALTGVAVFFAKRMKKQKKRARKKKS